MALGFAVLLLFGLWWWLFSPSSYAVSRDDLSGVLYYTDSITTATKHEFYGLFGHGDAIVIVGIGNHYEVTGNRAADLLVEMLAGGNYPDATLKRFSNAVVVCGVPEDCSNIVRLVGSNARERESRWVSSLN